MSTRRHTPCAAALGLMLLIQPMAGFAAVATAADGNLHSTSPQLAQRSGRSGGGSSGSRGGGSSRQTTRQSNQGTRQNNRQTNQGTRQNNRQTNQGTRQNNRQTNQGTRQNNRNDAVNSRQDGRTNRTDTRQDGRSNRVDNRNDTYRKAVNNWDRYPNGWYSGGSWTNNRPWNYGWYGGSYWNNWGWYPGQAAAWGIAGLATFSVINNLVNSAQKSQVSYIVVPSSSYSLYYPSVKASGDVVSFEADNGSSTVRYSANCKQGTLNGGAPRNADEAQLLNAACQVAFGK